MCRVHMADRFIVRYRTSGRNDRLMGEEGQSLIELALVLPVFLLMVFGFINFALIMFGVCNATYATRAALRYACVQSTSSYVPATQATLNTMIQPFIFGYPANTYTVTLGPTNTGNLVGSTAVVTLTLRYTISVPGYSFTALQMSTSASGVVVQ